MAKKKKCGKVIVVGGGVAGLFSTMRLAENGCSVDLFSLFPVKRSHTACAQGGINACLDTKGERDTTWQHFVDTVKGGAYLANQPPCKTLAELAPGIIRAYDRMGVVFSRTPEGLLDLRLFGGVKNRRTVFAGATTGQQLLYGLDEQVRFHEANGRVKKYEWWEVLSFVVDDEGTCRGVIAMNLMDSTIHAFRADAVVIATGGIGQIFGRSTMSTNSTGAGTSRAYQKGADYANGEFIQIHPTAIPGDDKNRLMSEACRGEGGRVWVPKDPKEKRKGKDVPESERFYFLEEWYPAYGNTVPRDVASRAIWKVVKEMGMGIYDPDTGKNQDLVYLDLTHLPREFLDMRLGGILELYEKFVGEDPRENPMKIFPSMHYSMGGLWTDYEKDPETQGVKLGSPRNLMTRIKGLFAAGECQYGYHGANRLGANSLLSGSVDGFIIGDSVPAYIRGLSKKSQDVPSSIFDLEKKEQERINKEIMERDEGENPFVLHRELGNLMLENVSIVRHNDRLKKTLEKLEELRERSHKIALIDKGTTLNTSLQEARQVMDMIVLAIVITKSALMRDECRGAHFKPEFEIKMPDAKEGDPEFEEYLQKWKANNEKWLKTTVAHYTPDGPEITYEDVDTSLYPPEHPRDYR